MSGVSVFFADDGSDTAQLWRTDGTAAGTFELTNFATANPAPSAITVADGVAYFVAADGAGPSGPQFQLWRSDGTAAGTFALGLSGDSTTAAPKVVQIGNTVYYVGEDSSHGESLFASTGGQAGQFVGSLVGPSGVQPVESMVAAGSDLLIEVGAAVFVSDGTAAGTHAYTDQGLSVDSNTAPFQLGGQTYLFASRNGDQVLYRDDGTTLTAVNFPNPNAAGSLMPVNGHVVFVVQGFDGTFFESWDGSSANAVQLVATGSPGPYYAEANGELYFGVSNPSAAQNPLSAVYVTDGTLAGAREVAAGDFNTVVPVGSNLILVGPSGSQAQPNAVWVSDGTVAGLTEVLTAGGDVGNFVQVGSEVFFNVDGNQLWVSDGTAAGTHIVQTFNTLTDLTADGSQLLFAAATLGTNTEPWISDGTTAGAHLIANIAAQGPGQLSIAAPVAFGADLAFIGQTGSLTNLWVSDGTAGGTLSVPTSVLTLSAPLVDAGGKLYFDVFDGESGSPLWVYTGSGAPGPIAADLDFQVSPQFLMSFNGELVFYGTNPGPQVMNRFGGGGLFITNGTDAGTSLLSSAAVLSQPIVLGGELLFLGRSGSNTGIFESSGTAGTATFVAAVPTGFATGGFTISGSEAFFVAGDNTTGAELWVTDGTAAGTHLVDDIAPGFQSSNPTGLTAFDGGVIFSADDGQHGEQAWFSNGAAAGTFQLAVNQTSDASASIQVGSAFTLGGKSYVIASTAQNTELLATDGTAGGTSVVATLNAGGVNQFDVQPLNGHQAIFDIQGQQLWITDGTSAGTFEVTGNFIFPSSDPALIVGGAAYFEGVEPGQPFSDLFVTSGGTGPATDIAADVADIFSGDGLVFYFAPASGADTEALYAYQPIGGTTTSLATYQGAGPLSPPSAAFVVESGGQALIGTPQGAQVAHLWVTDGTAAGTQTLAQAPGNAAFSDFTELGGKVYFGAFFASNAGNDGFWVTDGTLAGTHEILSIDVLNNSLAAVGGDLLFLATDSSNRTAGWSYDPSTGTATESGGSAATSLPSDFIVAGALGYFVANDASSQGELFSVTGGDTVTELTSPANGEIGNGSANTVSLAAMGSELFFSADDTTHGPSLFVTDGQTITFLAQVQNASDFTVIGSLLYFQGTDASNGTELWVSDGTPGGTHRVTDTEAANSAGASGFTAVGAKLFFSANDGVHGQELWVFNGQAGGATLVADIDPGLASSNPTDLTALGADAYFVADNGSGSELWRSDGTAAGTVAITSASDGANPQDLTVVGSELFFYGADSTHGAGLFVSHGAVGDATFLGAFTAVAELTADNGRLYFQGTMASGGSELWSSDGTAAGTLKLSTTGASPGASPSDFTPVGAAAPTHVASYDFNGDGRSDMLIENAAGAVVVGEVANGATAFTTVSALGPEWSFKGAGDFFGDGHEGYLIENAAGAVDVGEVTGGHAAYTQVTALGPEWTFHGAGDFLGDGQDQFLIENVAGAVAIGEAHGGSTAFTILGGLGPEWSFKGAGDFLADGKADFLIQNSGGTVAFGEDVGGTASFTVVGGLGPEWKFVGTGDFLGEGHDQFLIENAGGAVDVGDWTGGAIHFTQVAALGPEWKFVGAGDYLGEGHDQFLIENAAGAIDVGDWSNGAIHYTQVTALGPEWAFH